MSRSYKKTPYAGDTKHKEAKRTANRIFRNRLDKLGIDDQIPPSMHKKMSEPWDICDYYDITTLKEHLQHRKNRTNYYKGGQFDEKKEIRNWCKWYKWK